MADINATVVVNLKEGDPDYGTVTITHTLPSEFANTTEHGIGVTDPAGRVIRAYDPGTVDGTGRVFSLIIDLKVNGKIVYGDYTFSGYVRPNGQAEDAGEGIADKTITYTGTYSVNCTNVVPDFDFGFDCFNKTVYGVDNTDYFGITPAVQWVLDYPQIPGMPAQGDETIGAGTFSRPITHEGVRYSGKVNAQWSSPEQVLDSQEREEFVTLLLEENSIVNTTNTVDLLEGPATAPSKHPAGLPMFVESVVVDTLNSSEGDQVEFYLDVASVANTFATYRSEPVAADGTVDTGDAIVVPSVDVPTFNAIYLYGFAIAASGFTFNTGTLPGGMKLYTNGSFELRAQTEYAYEKVYTADVVCDLDSCDLNQCLEPVYKSLVDRACAQGGISTLSKEDRDKLDLLTVYQQRRAYYLSCQNSVKAAEYYKLILDLLNCSTGNNGPKPIKSSGVPSYLVMPQVQQDWTLFQNPELNNSLFSQLDLAYRIWTDRIEFRGSVNIKAVLSSNQVYELLNPNFVFPLMAVPRGRDATYFYANKRDGDDILNFAIAYYHLDNMRVTAGAGATGGDVLVLNGSLLR